jgi:hypothetical protein
VATLHIEHGITEFATWKAAFDRFAERRRDAGVTGHRIHQPHDDANCVVLQLDFPSIEQAQGFRVFLESRIWSVPANSPGLAGSPRARVLVQVPEE